MDPRCCRDEPGDHALGRSRGGLSTKIQAARSTNGGRPLAIGYDKRATVYRGGLVLAALLLWLTDSGDTS